MIDTKSQQILADVLRRETLSLLSYMGAAFPWTTVKGEPALQSLREVVAASSATITGLGRFLVKNKVTPPPLGSYPSYFTYLNFLALGHLLPKLIESERGLLGQLERDLPRLSKDAAAPVQAMLDVKRGGLEALQQLKPA